MVREISFNTSPYGSFKHLHDIVMIERYVVNNQLYSMVELSVITHHSQCVQCVDEGEGVVTKNVVDVDVVWVLLVRTLTLVMWCHVISDKLSYIAPTALVMWTI